MSNLLEHLERFTAIFICHRKSYESSLAGYEWSILHYLHANVTNPIKIECIPDFPWICGEDLFQKNGLSC